MPANHDQSPAGAKGLEIVKTLQYRVRRYDPANDSAPHWQTFEVPVHRGMTVLDGLGYIKENLDPTLVWRSSCRMAVCGSCAMFINGLPRLACETQILHLETDVIEVAPLPNMDNVRDLVPDLAPLFEKHRSIQPWLLRPDGPEADNTTAQYEQSP